MSSRVTCLIALIICSSPLRAEPPQATEDRILGDLQDGTPPEPEAPKPEFIVPANDILATKTLQQGGRTITIREIKPIDLPPPPVASPEPAKISPAFQAKLDAFQAAHPRASLVQIGATVYRSRDSATRTLGTYRPGGDEAPVSFCSSADFSLLSGFSSFVDSTGENRTLMMMWSSVDLTLLRELPAKPGRQYQPPAMPDLPAGEATFVITSTNPTAESLATIQSLHDLYNNEFQKLKTAYDAREQARLVQEAQLKAHPPQPKNITLNYWLNTSTDQDTTGGAR